MSVECAKCGEELMGSVNRCWSCGQEFVATIDEGNRPPIRRAPILAESLNVFVADVSDQSDTGQTAVSAEADVATEAGGVVKVRKGSPFGDRGTAVLESMERPKFGFEHEVQAPRAPEYEPSGGSKASAALVLPLGVISLVLAFLFPIGGVVLAVLGAVLAIWGLQSRRRGVAIVGLVICCLSLAFGTFNFAVAIYSSYYGLLPWESAPTF